MSIRPAKFVRDTLEHSGMDVHFLHVTQDRRVMICRTSHPEFSDSIAAVPALLIHLCINGGGPIKHCTNQQIIQGNLSPGSIGIIPPGSIGTGSWPAMTVISFGIAVSTVAESFGAEWPNKLNADKVSQIFHDPLVETTMRDIGLTRAGNISDAGLVHAAHMITHQLLDPPMKSEVQLPDVPPMNRADIKRIEALIDANLDKPISIAEMAKVAGNSRHHFSRRFKAATGRSPLQYVILRKLGHAAALLEENPKLSVLDVSQHVGYSNPAHFSRAFKNHFGQPPRNWKYTQARTNETEAH